MTIGKGVPSPFWTLSLDIVISKPTDQDLASGLQTFWQLARETGKLVLFEATTYMKPETPNMQNAKPSLLLIVLSSSPSRISGWILGFIVQYRVELGGHGR